MTSVVTGEAVALELPVATFPTRIAARLLDMILQGFLLIFVFAVLAVTSSQSGHGDYFVAEILTVFVLVIVGYPTVFETLSRGKTLGKMALGIRVVGDDGSPVRFRQALVRALVGALEIWSIALAPVALITSIVSARGKRVGDVFAGTYVIQERSPARQSMPPAFAVVPPPLAAWAQVLQVARLSDQTAEAAGSYLRRFAELSPQARDALGVQLANAVAAEVSPLPPDGTPPAAYLAAVLAVRRAHDLARFAPVPPIPMQTMAAQPVTAQPGTSQPGTSQPGTSQPGTSQPVTGQPVAPQPNEAEPADAETGVAEPADVGPVAPTTATGPPTPADAPAAELDTRPLTPPA